MVYYLQRECNTSMEISSDAIVEFDTELALSAPEDFVYHPDGSIDILNPGTYNVFFQITSMGGQSTVGQSYMLKRRDYQSAGWAPVAGTSNHTKVSQTVGFATVVVEQDEIDTHEKATIALFHMADDSVKLTMFAPQAGILIFGHNYNLLDEMDARITNIQNQITQIQNDITVSEVTTIDSLEPTLRGLSMSVLNIGQQYNFWGSGKFSSNATLNNGTTYWIVRNTRADFYPPLAHYVGDPTVAIAALMMTNGNVYTIPVVVDHQGIRFTPSTQITGITQNCTFNYTLLLFLAPHS